MVKWGQTELLPPLFMSCTCSCIKHFCFREAVSVKTKLLHLLIMAKCARNKCLMSHLESQKTLMLSTPQDIWSAERKLTTQQQSLSALHVKIQVSSKFQQLSPDQTREIRAKPKPEDLSDSEKTEANEKSLKLTTTLETGKHCFS